MRKGLSPQARGNPKKEEESMATQGPIPAGAGQPELISGAPALEQAYPRRRGATAGVPVSSPTSAGLSPQARGNLHDFDDGKYPERPIPAGAGQPPSDPGIYPNRTAYPRRRGATRRLRSQRLHYIGLSPQARGNRRETDIPRRYAGPIPAGAGQPQASQRIPSSRRAYPRRRGATQFRELTDAQVEGLSPQARGNPVSRTNRRSGRRPIPAGAGQPGRLDPTSF